ncbi:DUF554 domain-containing protein [Anaerotignum lactatifermentans]|uniref:DUF554 domain-containing protein n=2 Tax=Anaerotignum lactatifermentans TaxID=160404 RepID=A0ABS2GCV0_9FIRM|nr:DUF554 domain-containing protein [Anaerotignum lactatifermentans]MBM6830168.1 DUF554 domain-containing protein [Anaerotignum lactatifermentans]MBM6878687.1 DUF554 domain-containing protein [Anaerotignum lactatifermentans]MBM6951781.1 DUF554 domain-containing protein [Anaerotignum lactatifermentans]
MIGTIVNTSTILIGSVVGSLLRKGVKPQYQDVLFNSMGLAAAGLGINAIVQNMPNSVYPVLFIASLAIGSLVGNILDIDRRFQSLTGRFSSSNLGEGLSTAILLFCIGTLSIVGPIQSALYGDHTYLLTNATLDLVTSAVLASTYGIGIALAAPILFCWQGAIYLFAGFLSEFLTDALMCEISVIGGFLIASSGIGILKIKDLKTLNMLPSLLVPPLFFALKALILG